MVRSKRKRDAETDLTIIRTINRQRHDWMNDLQVMLGFLRLRKYDQLQHYVDKIRAKALVESYISKLGIPSLIVYFLSFPAEHKALSLEVEIDQEINLAELPLDGEQTERLVIELAELFHEHAELAETEPNMLSIGFDLEETSLLLDFVYTGAYMEKLREELVLFAAGYSSGYAGLESDCQEGKAIVTVRIPFH